MKILITGGFGFIGSHIVDSFVNKGWEVVVVELSYRQKKNVNKEANYSIIENSSFSELAKIIAKFNPDVVSHHLFIDIYNSKRSFRTNIYDRNLSLLKNVVQGISESSNCRKMVFPSSVTVYGDQRGYLDESSKKMPLHLYSKIKSDSEEYINTSILSKVSKGISVSLLRYSNVYGPRQKSKKHEVFQSFFNATINNSAPLIHGSGQQKRDFIFIDDVVKANEMVVSSDYSGALNITTSTPITLKRLWGVFKSFSKKNTSRPVFTDNENFMGHNIYRNFLAKDKIGWFPEERLTSGILKTVRWYEENSDQLL